MKSQKRVIFSDHKDIDGIIFDCDGVLIDVSNSYDLAIKRTTSYILQEILNIKKVEPVSSQIIEAFKATGGFNDEVDLTYSAILGLFVAHSLNKNEKEFLWEVIKNADHTGIKSVEKFLSSFDVDISELKTQLQYPGRHLDSLLYKVFDQIFYGPELYFKLFKEKSSFSENGLIENDVVLLQQKTIDILKKKVDKKLAIVSGRGMESIRFSLRELLDEFDIKHSKFLEDQPRELAKPNPKPLLETIEGLGCQHCLYVGDSIEDFLMSKKVNEFGRTTSFCGIYGTSKFPEQKKKLFEEKGVDLILKSIDLLPKALNLV